jgi:hypothetical protein
MADRWMRTAAGAAATGVYRTSFLAADQFGIGRHPLEGLHGAGNFAFALLVEATPDSH